jgi:ATP-binding cassette subfamily F protein uup
VDWFADYAQWESAQERAGGSAPESKSDGRTAATQDEGASATPARKVKKMSYREQKEWGTIEEDILKAEEQVTACQAAIQDPAVMSDAAALQARSQALVAAQAEVERLYARWTELEEKRAQAVQSS